MSQDATARRFRVHARYDSPYRDSIRFVAGDVVIAGETYTEDPDWKDWIRCSDGAGRDAWVPRQFLSLSGSTATFLRDNDARELTIVPGQIIDAIETVNGFALGRTTEGEVGWVPLKCMAPLPE